MIPPVMTLLPLNLYVIHIMFVMPATYVLSRVLNLLIMYSLDARCIFQLVTEQIMPGHLFVMVAKYCKVQSMAASIALILIVS